MTISTTAEAEFCDTNVLVYAYDPSDAIKQARAVALTERLWSSRTGALSIQVLQEFYVTVTRRIAGPLPHDVARSAVEYFSAWRVYAPTPGDVVSAIDASARWQISFWDAMLVVAADKVGASTLWSEDLNDGQTYGGVTVRNPFR